MTTLLPILLALLAQAPAGPTPAKAKPQPIFDEAADGSAQIARALARAGKENRRVLVEWGANWCAWCRSLHALCGRDEAIRRELLYEYDVVLLDVGRMDKHADLMGRYGVDLSKTGIPFLTVLDADGRVVANQETASLELPDKKGYDHDPAKVLAFLEARRAPARKAEDVLAAGLEQARREDRRVFLHFGAPWCGWCRKLETWMEAPEVAGILAKELLDVKVDVDRALGGKELLARLRGDAEQGIPWFVVLDAQGQVLARGDGAEGRSIGFPYEPSEIEAFGAVLAKGTRKLSAEDVDALKRSLQAFREREERAKAPPARPAQPGG
jgi:thiol:disulfide interchange protein